MQTYILSEGVLNDNVLFVADKGKVFKHGFIAIVKEYTFLNTQSNKENVINFKSSKVLFKYLDKHYKDVDLYFFGSCVKN